jgi:putative membrane protein
MRRHLQAAGVLLAKGFCMGAADVVPGVSGGTMAFILGIYTRLIDAIKSFDAAWIAALLRVDVRTAVQRPHFGFLIPLGLGIVAAVAFFTHVVPIPALLHTHPEHVYGLFFGLIVGSILILFVDIGWRSPADGAELLIGLIIGGAVVTAVPTETPDAWWFIMGSGAIAICAMVLPGISGSFILLILGKYAYILDGIGSLDFAIIVPFAVGAAFGLAAFARLLSWLLHRFERPMLLVISGFLVASLWVIWPFQQRHYVEVRGKQRLLESTPVAPHWDSVTLEAALLAAVGVAIVIAATRYADRHRVKRRWD